jgi:hypothetical protein
MNIFSIPLDKILRVVYGRYLSHAYENKRMLLWSRGFPCRDFPIHKLRSYLNNIHDNLCTAHWITLYFLSRNSFNIFNIIFALYVKTSGAPVLLKQAQLCPYSAFLGSAAIFFMSRVRQWEFFPHPETSPHLQPHTAVTNPAFV